MTPRALLTLAALACLAAGTAPAQVLPLTVPRGRLRFDFDGGFESYDWRWRDGTREEWAAPFDGPLDRRRIPGLAATEAILARITNLSDVGLTVGRADAASLVNVGTLGLGASVGITDRLTVFGRIPLVRVKVRAKLAVDETGATAGFNPADPVFGTAAGQAQASRLLAQIQQAADLVQGRLDAGDFDADPATRALAQQTVARATSLHADLLALLLSGTTSSTFTPTEASAAGAAIAQILSDLRQTFQTLGTSVLTTSFPFAAGGLTRPDLDNYVTSADGPIAGLALTQIPEITFLGDIELGGAYALLDRFPRDDYGTGIRSVVEGTVRLRTARLDSPDRFLDVGTGDRQPDVEVRLVTDLTSGRFGARLEAGYNLQLPGNQNRRVAPPGQPFAPVTSLAGVRRNPGDVWHIRAQPFFRLATFLSLTGSVEYRRKGLDGYAYVSGQPPIEGVDLGVLATGSSLAAIRLAGGVSYSHSGLDKRGQQKYPLDASLLYERVARAGTGILPDASRVMLNLRFYTGLWR